MYKRQVIIIGDGVGEVEGGVETDASFGPVWSTSAAKALLKTRGGDPGTSWGQASKIVADEVSRGGLLADQLDG